MQSRRNVAVPRVSPPADRRDDRSEGAGTLVDRKGRRGVLRHHFKLSSEQDGYQRLVEDENCRQKSVRYEQVDAVEEWESFLLKMHRQAEHQQPKHGKL